MRLNPGLRLRIDESMAVVEIEARPQAGGAIESAALAGALSATPAFEAGSFRDHDGRVFRRGDRLLRALSPAMLHDWSVVSQRPFFQQSLANGTVVATGQLPDLTASAGLDGAWAAVLEHETLPVITYPHEWCFGMLRDAALLQLDLLAAALRDDVILKDATPFNVQFRGTRPVFIDIGSFAPYAAGTPWVAYRQFCSMYLYPLLLQAYRGLDIQPWFRGSLSGIAPRDCRRMFSWTNLWRPGLLTHVWLHAAIDRHVRVDDEQVSEELRQQGFQRSLIERNVAGLRRLISRLNWSQTASRWSGYDRVVETDAAAVSEKEQFVSQVLASRRWSTVWDLGCNAGRYSRMAAEHADLVLAIDGDHATVERLYQTLKQEDSTRIVPLKINLADPSPGLGWRGRERTPLEDRSRPELILCLALLHHLVLGENLPLAEVVGWLAEFRASLVLEFVDVHDRQVRGLRAQRSDAGHRYSQTDLETELQRHFQIVRTQRLPGDTRTLYHLEPLR